MDLMKQVGKYHCNESDNIKDIRCEGDICAKENSQGREGIK